MEGMKDIAGQWLKAYAYTVATSNIDGHLDLVSPRLKVIGISRNGFLEYPDWARRRRNDIAQRRLLRICHGNLVMGSCSPGCIRFTVEETLKSTTGERYVLHKQVELNLEAEGKWRQVEEFIHNVCVLPASDNKNVTQPAPAAAPGEAE